MSIEVRIPKEITEYKEKILFGLSIRQLLCFTVAIVCGVGTYILASKFLGTDFASYLVIIEVMPVFAVGFVKKNGFPFEKYAALMFNHKFGTNKRGYGTSLLIDMLKKESDNTENKKKRSISKDVSATKTKNKKTKDISRECESFEVTKKGRKRKSKEAIRQIKAARQEYRRKKQADQKAAKEGSRTKNLSNDNKIQKNV